MIIIIHDRIKHTKSILKDLEVKIIDFKKIIVFQEVSPTIQNSVFNQTKE